MTKQSDPVNNLRIASPCAVGWEGMSGDDRLRFRSLCNLHVYNISEMTSEQIRSLVISTEDRICARLYRRADGTVITRACPIGLRALRSRVSKVAAPFAAILSMCTGAIAQSSLGKNQSCAHTSQLEIKRSASKTNKLL